MSKRISDLNEAKANRARNSAQSPEPERPRLADRLVTLAPLARAPLVAEHDPDPLAEELMRLADTPRFGNREAGSSRNALVPRGPAQLPRAQEPARLARVSAVPPVDIALDGEDTQLSVRTIAGFLIGLSIATAIGLGLYVYLT